MRRNSVLKLSRLVRAFSLLLSLAPMTILADAAPSAKAFGELPIGYDGAISPDGNRIALIMNYGGRYTVISKLLVDGDEEHWALGLGEGVKPRYIKWVNNDRFVIAIRQSEMVRGTPFTSTFLFTGDLKARKSRVVIRSKDIFRQFNDRVVDWLEDDPEHILMAFSDQQGNPYPDLKKVAVASGRYKTAMKGKRGIEYWATDEDGTPRIGTGQTANGKQRRIIYNSDTKKWQSSDIYPGISPDTPVFGIIKDGSELVIGDYQEKDTLGVYVYNLKQKQIVRSLFHSDEFDASGVVLSNDGETVIGAKYTAENDKTELLGDYGTLLNLLRSKYEGYNVDYIDQTEDGSTVLVRMSAPYDPGGLFLFSEGDTAPSKLTKMYRGFSAADTGDVVAVKYTARDGQKIPAFVTLPPGLKSPKNLPFIILPHGGPYARDSTRFDYFAQFFATRGYGVLQMNFRGSDGYGKTYAEAGRSNWVVMQQDVEDGARWLFDKGYADSNRSCIAGWSYGGYAALMGVSTDPDLYKCAIAMAALTDINDARRDLRKYRGGKHAAKKFFGDSLQDKKTRAANSPVNLAGKIKVPVFLAHGELDENVQFDQFTRMKKALDKAGVDTTYMRFSEEDHYLSAQENREAFFIGLERFLKKVNGTSEYMRK